MTEGVINQETAAPDVKRTESQQSVSDKELNFRRLEAAKEAEREARIRADMRNEQLEREIQQIKEMMKPKEEDPLDGVEDHVDPDRLRAKFAKERASFKREAEEIAKKTYENIEAEKHKTNFQERLRSQYRDYEDVMNETNIAELEKSNPAFLEAVLAIPDEYVRREKTYKFLKANPVKSEPRPSIQEKVDENARNPYYIAPGSGTPAAVEFDTRSKSAREQAYQKLKAAQRRPVGTGQTGLSR